MAQIDPIRFGDVTLLLGDGVTPTEGFDAPCGLTQVTWTTQTETQTEDLPNCDGTDTPGYQAPVVVSTGDTIQGQGFVDVEGHDTWLAYIRSGQPKNIRVAYDKGTKVGWYQGPAIATNREEGYERRQAGRINVSLQFTEAPVWTPAP